MSDTPTTFFDLPTRRRASGIDVETALAHFAIVTYRVDPGSLRPHVHERFSLDTIFDAEGREWALISVVPFLDLDFRFAICPWPKHSFGQTNYRAYVTDRTSGEHVAWFFGTALDTIFVNVPRHVWKLPWHSAKIRFNVAYDPHQRRHTRYHMSTQSEWAPADLELVDTGEFPGSFLGFPDREAGFRLLTHPAKGFFHRRDGRLGTYSIWHERMQPAVGRAVHASFPLLDRLGLVETGSLDQIHSVLMQPVIDFTIYLPPRAL